MVGPPWIAVLGSGPRVDADNRSHTNPLTGKPDAGDPPVRFGGRGSGKRSPYPYPFLLLRACPEIRFWVAQAAGLYRPATRRAEGGARPEAMKMGLLHGAAALFRSAGRRPARAGRPCYPFVDQP